MKEEPESAGKGSKKWPSKDRSVGRKLAKCPVIVSTPRDFRLIIVIPIAVRQESRVLHLCFGAKTTYWRLLPLAWITLP